MSDEDRMRSEIARMQMRGDELTDQVHANMICVKEIILFLSYVFVQFLSFTRLYVNHGHKCLQWS